MSKVAIMTFYGAYNYGAVWQAYALRKKIQDMGYDCELINYSTRAFLELRKDRSKIQRLCDKVKKALKDPIFYINVYIMEYGKKRKIKRLGNTVQLRDRKFDEFTEMYLKTNGRKYNTHSALVGAELDYDVYVCGSDQIWNPKMCDMDSNYFLQFVDANKRIAYAPSIGISTISSKEWQERFKKFLGEMEYISVREKQGALALEHILHREVRVVLDPTLLMDRAEWEELLPPMEEKEPYILNYFLGDDKYVHKYLNAIEKKYEKKYKIINLLFDFTSCGPIEMLSLIRGAKMVFTNSFHGMLLSINFNVPFVVGKTLKDTQKENGLSRVDEIMATFKIRGRIWTLGESMREEWEIMDYTNVNEVLIERKKDSMAYLRDAIKSVVGGR